LGWCFSSIWTFPWRISWAWWPKPRSLSSSAQKRWCTNSWCFPADLSPELSHEVAHQSFG
jgi:hypothetical protein